MSAAVLPSSKLPELPDQQPLPLQQLLKKKPLLPLSQLQQQSNNFTDI